MSVKLPDPLVYSGRLTYPSESPVHTNMYRSEYMARTTNNSKDGNRWLDLHHDHGESASKIMAG